MKVQPRTVGALLAHTSTQAQQHTGAHLLGSESPPGSRRPPEPFLAGAGATPHLHHERPARFRIPRAASRARQVAAALLVGFAALFATAAQAQTVVTLVSNTGQTVGGGASNTLQAQSFETGANAAGYTITEVQLRLGNNPSNTSVKIREDDSGEPGDLVATLTNPLTFTAAAFNTFTAPANRPSTRARPTGLA